MTLDPTGVERQDPMEWYTSEEAVSFYTDQISGLFDHERLAFSTYLTQNGARVLDLGCGTGRTTSYLAALGFDVTGLDISQPMIEAARRRSPDIEFVLGDASILGFASDSFDYVVYSFNGLDYAFPEERRFETLLEIHRVLVKSGVFVFSSHKAGLALPPNPFNPISYLRKLRSILGLGESMVSVDGKYEIDADQLRAIRTYYISPDEQKRQLREFGFEVVDVLSRLPGPLSEFDPWPYYVAKK